MATSQNGWTVLGGGTTGPHPRLRKWIVPGAESRHFYLRDGSAGFILTWIAVWWDENIRPIDIGIFDEWGFASRPVRGQSSGYSNHASGTAIDVDATRHPRGVPVNRNLTPAQVDAIHDMLRYLDGVIRWGGDYNSTVDAMHFELNRPLADAERLALKLAETPKGKAVLAANPGAWQVISSGTSAEGKPQPGTVVEPPPPPPEPKPEPKPKPKPEPVETEHPFTVALLPGRFDAPVDAWLVRRDEAIREGADIVVFTEAHRDRIAKALEPEGYDSARIAEEGPSNVMAVWDSERFELASDPYSVQLDTQQVWTKRGRLRPQTFAVVYPLRDILADKILLLCAAHLPLENTPRRRIAKEQALQALRDEAFAEGVRRHPTDSTRMLAADWNRNSKSDKVRDWFAETWPGMTPAWVARPRSVIDWQAGGKRLELLKRWFLKRRKDDPLDHRTTLATWAWDK